jgi:hypothetical protein
VGTGGGAPSASTALGVGVGEAFGLADFGFVGRGEVRFCALVMKLCGNRSAPTVKSSRITSHLLLLVRIIWN